MEGAAMAAAPRVLGGGGTDAETRSVQFDFAKPAGRIAVAAGLIYLIGHLLDFGILWILQRQPGLQWEFVALARTAEAFPDMIVATALIYIGLYTTGSLGLVTSRMLATLTVLMGVAGLAIMGLMVLNYLGIRAEVSPEAAATVRSSVLKTVSLAALYAAFLIPAGILGYRVRSRR
jgi:uncharacterized PurR-regulated membrane protein YhhQ (DUF165 family)